MSRLNKTVAMVVALTVVLLLLWGVLFVFGQDLKVWWKMRY